MTRFTPFSIQLLHCCPPSGTVSLKTTAPGVRPVLAIEPESGIVDFGAVVYQEGEKDYLTREVLVKNQDKSGPQLGRGRQVLEVEREPWMWNADHANK